MNSTAEYSERCYKMFLGGDRSLFLFPPFLMVFSLTIELDCVTFPPRKIRKYLINF